MKLIARTLFLAWALSIAPGSAHAFCFDVWIKNYNYWGPQYVRECAGSTRQVCNPEQLSRSDRKSALQMGAYSWNTAKRYGEDSAIRMGWHCAGRIGLMISHANMSDHDTQCRKVAEKWIEQIYAVALAGANKKCNWCPADSLLDSKIGRNLSKVANSAGAKAWDKLTQTCSPDQNAQARSSGPASRVSSEATSCKGNGPANCEITGTNPAAGITNLYVRHQLARAGCLELARQARERGSRDDLDYYDVVRAAIIKNDRDCGEDFMCPSDPEKYDVSDFWASDVWQRIRGPRQNDPISSSDTSSGGGQANRTEARYHYEQVVQIAENRCGYNRSR